MFLAELPILTLPFSYTFFLSSVSPAPIAHQAAIVMQRCIQNWCHLC